MKVLMLNGSPRAEGNTYTALAEIGRQLELEGIEFEIFQLGAGPQLDCTCCGGCKDGHCVFDGDRVNEFIDRAREADGFIFGSPVYYAHPSGRVLSLLDRAFYAGSAAFRHKPGASVAVARRGGTSATFDCMNKYFGIAGMPVVGSTYWNLVHGRKPGEAIADGEGMQTMRNLARNMAWLLRSIEAGRAAGVRLPEEERGQRTDFIR